VAKASIWIEDDGSSVIVGADFGDKLEQDSQAHQMVYTLLQSVLGTANSVTEIENTAGDLNGESAEPSRIIVPN
jgi:hypothetical protein